MHCVWLSYDPHTGIFFFDAKLCRRQKLSTQITLYRWQWTILFSAR